MRPAESFRLQDDPRVRELGGKLDAAKADLARASREFETAEAELARAAGEANLAEALVEVGEGDAGVAKRARREVDRLEATVAALTAERARKGALAEALAQRLVEAEGDAAERIRVRVRERTRALVLDLDEALREAMRRNQALVELKHELTVAGLRVESLAWEALREVPRMHGSPETVIRHWRGNDNFGESEYEAWRKACAREGIELPDA